MLCYHKFLYLGVKDKKTLRKIWLRPGGPAFSRLEAGAKMIQDDHTPRERLGLVSLAQPNMTDGLGFARKQLEKHGWSEGKITCLSNENEIFTNKAVNEGTSKFVP